VSLQLLGPASLFEFLTQFRTVAQPTRGRVCLSLQNLACKPLKKLEIRAQSGDLKVFQRADFGVLNGSERTHISSAAPVWWLEAAVDPALWCQFRAD
jgi:hypothetical protein